MRRFRRMFSGVCVLRTQAARPVARPGTARFRWRCSHIRPQVNPSMASNSTSAPNPQVRKGQGDMRISEQEFRRRLRERFYDPAFEGASEEIDRIAGIAWEAYSDSRKSPKSRAAGAGFADPQMQLSEQWL